MRVNGLYGHVRRNDARSVMLFAAFVAAFHVLALLSLLVPLAMLDQAHAPLTAPLGYVVRWMPLVTVLGGVLFGVQMAWHVRHVRIRTAFRFVDASEEPRLFRILAPLAITAGLTAPNVGVIDSPALNAFACGIRRNDAVLVFTRGLLDGLDDEELAAVVAHELSHVVHRDIRLIAAANVCLDSLRVVAPRPPADDQRLGYLVTMPVLMLLTPMLFVLVLVVGLARKLAVDASHLTRLLIASSREFVADAEAVRLTQNPAALVAALQRIEGRSAIPGLTSGQDAMLIDGAQDGAMATHPPIAERVRAIVAVTGMMALIAPSRRDTRPVEARSDGGFGRRSAGVVTTGGPVDTRSGLARVAETGALNRLGMTREMTLGTVAAVVLFFVLHAGDLSRPRALLAAFDPTPMIAFLGLAGQGATCELRGMIGLAEGRGQALPAACRGSTIDQAMAPFRGQPNILGLMARGTDLADEERQDREGITGNPASHPPVRR